MTILTPRSHRFITSRLRATTAMTGVLMLVAATPSYALPVGAQVVGGQATLSGSATTLNITQSTDRAILNWQSFDIGVGEHVAFLQPSASSVTLNRVTGSQNPSQILGSLSANGTVILVNQSGVLFGPNSQVNVGSLVVTTSDIPDSRFMDGDYHFDIRGRPDAAIVNDGIISIADAGLAAFVAPNVVNNGLILAKLGKVQLASGDAFTLDMYGDGLVNLQAGPAIASQLVSNSGVISANGGTVTLTTAAAESVVDSLINMDGIIQATSIGERNGEIVIFAEGSNAVRSNVAADKGVNDGSSTVLISGVLDASGRNPGERGGKVTVTGDNVALLDGTLIDASGYEGKAGTTEGKAISARRDGSAGGDIRIGGDYLGGGDTPTAKNLYVDPGVLVLNDALSSGDAGRTIFWSDGTTQFYGNVYARALGGKPVDPLTWNATSGGNAGDGGFVETSGHEYLDAGGYVDLTASNGNRGTYFLDPSDITIYGTFDPTDVAGLSLWLDPSDSATVFSDTAGTTSSVDGGSVARWNDKSGQGNHVTAATGEEPLWQTNSINGLSTLFFDGSLKKLTRNNGVGGGSASTFFSAWAPNDVQYNLFLSNATDSYYRTGDGTGYLGLFRNARVTGPIGMPSTGTHLLSLVSSATTYNAYLDGVNKVADAADYNAGDQISIGIGPNAGNYTGNLMDVLVYQSALLDSQRQTLEQYLSAKWGIALTSPGTGATEVAKATAADGYSVFTTRYLERLSQSADISLQATNNINLDFKGDTLAMASDRSLSLTTTNGTISSVSAGTIQTMRTGSGGNITITAGGSGNIAINDVGLNATGGGVINMTSGGTISVTSPMGLSLGTVSGTSVNLRTTGATSDLAIASGGSVTATNTSVNSLVLAAGRNFINNAGSSALSTTGTGRWLVYSTNPANDTIGGLASNFRLFFCTYGGSCPSIPGAGNGLLYSSTVPLTADQRTVITRPPVPQDNESTAVSDNTGGDQGPGEPSSPTESRFLPSSSSLKIHVDPELQEALGLPAEL